MPLLSTLSFHLGVRYFRNCSLCWCFWNYQPVCIFVSSSAKPFMLFKAFRRLLLQAALSTPPLLFAFSTSRGTLLAGFQEVGWGGKVLGWSREANILPPPCYHPLTSTLRNYQSLQRHPHFLPSQPSSLTSGKLSLANVWDLSSWRTERLEEQESSGIAAKRAVWRCHLVWANSELIVN